MSTTAASVRERILEATRALLVAGSNTELRLQDVAKAAGVSRQTLYVHFGNRTALFVETARYLDEQEGLGDRTAPYRSAPDAPSALHEYVRFWANYIPVVYPLARVLLAAYDRDEAARAAWDDRMADVRRGCGRVVARLREEGRLAPAWTEQAAGDLFYGVVSLRTWELLTHDCGWSQAQYVERMEKVLQETLLAE